MVTNNSYAYGLNSNSIFYGLSGNEGKSGLFLYLCDYNGNIQRKLISERIKSGQPLLNNYFDLIKYNNGDKFVDTESNLYYITDISTGDYTQLKNISYEFFIETYRYNNKQRIANDYVNTTKFLKDNINVNSNSSLNNFYINLYGSSLKGFNEVNIDNKSQNFKVWNSGDKCIGFKFENGTFKFGNNSNVSNDVKYPLVLDFKNINIDYDQTYTNMLLTNNNINADGMFDQFNNVVFNDTTLNATKDASSNMIITISPELNQFDKEIQVSNKVMWGEGIEKLDKKILLYVNNSTDSDPTTIVFEDVSTNSIDLKLSIYNLYGWSRTYTKSFSFTN